MKEIEQRRNDTVRNVLALAYRVAQWKRFEEVSESTARSAVVRIPALRILDQLDQLDQPTIDHQTCAMVQPQDTDNQNQACKTTNNV